MFGKILSAWLIFCVLICKPVLPLKMSVDNVDSSLWYTVCVHDQENAECMVNLLRVDLQTCAALEDECGQCGQQSLIHSLYT